MYLPDLIYALNNFESSFLGVFNASGMTGSNFNIASAYANSPTNVIGMGAPADGGAGGSGYGGGGVNPGTGAPGAASLATGGMFGVAMDGSKVGGQNPQCKTAESSAPTDSGDSIATELAKPIVNAANVAVTSTGGGNMTTPGLNDCVTKPNPTPANKTGCTTCPPQSTTDLWNSAKSR